MSVGCTRCYAERLAIRQVNGPYKGLVKSTPAGPRWTGVVRFVPEVLDAPLRWRAPRRIFVNSMSDLFHEGLPFEQITAIYGVMAASMQHTFQVLTKRPARRLEWTEWVAARGGLGPYIRSDEGRPALRNFYAAGTRTEVYRGKTIRSVADAWAMVMNAAAVVGEGPLDNVWEGVSVEDQATADARIPVLLQTPAAVRWVSYEPSLGPVDFRPWLTVTRERPYSLDWIVSGGESGPGARPNDLAWHRTTRDQCRAAGVAYFCKQLGGGRILDRGYVCRQWCGRGACADPAEWPADLRVQEFPG